MRKLCIALGMALLLPVQGAGIALAAGGAGAGPAMGGGGNLSSGSDELAGRRDEKADATYREGLEKREAALALEKAAAEAASDAQRAQQLETARKTWEEALALFKDAARQRKDFYQALNEVGHAQRKLGHYRESLEAYDRALKIEPGFAPAIEYRGEAYLGLNRIDDAKNAYMQLFQRDRSLAAQLMQAFDGWAKQAQTTPPAGVDAQALQEFISWIRERKDLAAQVGESSGSKPW